METVPGARGRIPRRKSRGAWRRYGTVLLFMSPWLIGFIAFYALCFVVTWAVYLRRSPAKLTGV